LATFTPPKFKNVEQKKVGVSVIIAARNELANLAKLLTEISKQNYPLFELILVDDCSDDGSTEYVLQFQKTHSKTGFDFKYIQLKEKPKGVNGKKYALQQGILASKYKILLFTDADCIPTNSDWIQEMTKPFWDSNTEIVLGFSPYFSQKSWLNLWVQYETFYTAVQYLSFALTKIPYMGVGRNLAYRKELFESKEGFDTHLKVLGGDDDLFVGEHANRTNTVVVLNKKSQTQSQAENTWLDWIAQKKRHLSVGVHYQVKHKISLAFLQGSHFVLIIGVLVLILWSDYELLGITLWVFRTIALSVQFGRIQRKLQSKVPIFFVFGFDFLYISYFTLLGIASFTTKAQWKKRKKHDSFQPRH
jgi:glycosyltransferase involved in cell wall biosynthesis